MPPTKKQTRVASEYLRGEEEVVNKKNKSKAKTSIVVCNLYRLYCNGNI